MRILKVGGSVITKKEIFEELNEDAIEEVCSAISKSYSDLILIHGAGSFGHPHVKLFGLESTLSIAKIHNACVRLNEFFCRRLIDHSVPAIGLHPMSCDFKKIEKILKKGFLPVIHGDVNYDFKVVSGDDLAVKLAERFKAESLGFATNVEGVFVNGIIVNKLHREMSPDAIGEEDATGKMKGKIGKIFSMRHKCRVFVFKGNGENIKKFLEGKEVGTEVIL
ncbi:MAG: isopentenyl phosphate kinase [Archaeoglobaceae archaeon]|nr:isopentenyl phosphate kinase [Archaeoglobaceae archaeon]MDW7989995.1 isopentenyl phosphate kinase [Archaeoglobaceae archaeon]